MVPTHLFLEAMGHLVEAFPLPARKYVLDVLVQFSLVGLHRQQVLGPAVHNLLGDVLLTPHGVNGDQTSR